MMKVPASLAFVLLPFLVPDLEGGGPVRSRWEVVDSSRIAEVPADFPVGFSLLTRILHQAPAANPDKPAIPGVLGPRLLDVSSNTTAGLGPAGARTDGHLRVFATDPDEESGFTAGKRQYAAYYDKFRRMTVASRILGSRKWEYRVLPSRVGWDSHDYITMAVDGDGNLHVSGNMHCEKLVYFRTVKPGDISTLERFPMTGKLEDRVTYPRFLTDNEGNLIFTYRNGSSGNGMRLFNKYDRKTHKWERLLAKPLLDGEGKRNAYPLGPLRGPDGFFHLVWVWRDTPDCATNHHLSYARSRDLVHWESAFGKRVELPITLREKSLWVDPIPSGGGIINGCERLAFDGDKRPIITYHKADANGWMQIYAARPEGGMWVLRRLTSWKKPVIFGGYGSMGFIGIRISGLNRVGPGLFTMTYRHRDYGRGRLMIDGKTLRPLKKKIPVPPLLPRKLERPRSRFKGMGIRRAWDLGGSGEKGVRYLLQ